MQRLILTALILWSGFALAAEGEIYRWTDEQGRVIFGDTPPEESQAEHLDHLETRGNPLPPPPGIHRPSLRSKPDLPHRSGGKDRLSKQLKEARERRKKCANYREKLDKLRDRMRSGYSVRVAEQLRQRELRYKESIARYCSR